MQRVLSTSVLLGLLVATAAAFAVTEHLKLIKSPLYATQVTRVISPGCGCATAKATIGLVLRRADRLTVTIQGAGGRTVATLETLVRKPKGPVDFTWDGRTDAGTRAPDGSYRPQIYLQNARWRILLPPSDRITVDTTKPKVLSASVRHPVFSPSGGHTISIRYALSKRAHVTVYLNGQRIIRGRASRAHDTINWAGTAGGSQVPAGRYVLSIGAVDLAGNATPASERKSVVVEVRYIALARSRILVHPGARFTVGVETGAARYRWRLARRRGTAKGKLLHVRAPGKRGTYRLVVSEGGHSAIATVVVGAK